MRILSLMPYYIHASRAGGPAQQLHRLAQGVQRCGSRLEVVTTNGNLEEDIALKFAGEICPTDENGIAVTYLRRRRFPFPPTFYYAPLLPRWLATHLADYDIAIVHGAWTYFNMVGAGLCRRWGKPYLVFPHGSFDPWAWRYHGWKKVLYWHGVEKRNYQGCAGVVALSADEAGQIHARGIDRPVFLARNGLLFPLPSVEQPREVLGRHWPDLSRRPYVCSISRLHPKKGIDILLSAWAQIYERYQEWQLVIAGPDENQYLAKLQALAQSWGIHQTVIFTGAVEGIVKSAMLQCASAFVLPSLSEGVPGAVVEALGYGLPVLITPACHLPEVAAADAGVIVASQPEAVAAGLEQLLADRQRRQQWGRNAAQLAHREFDEVSVAAGLIEFCTHLLQDGR